MCRKIKKIEPIVIINKKNKMINFIENSKSPLQPDEDTDEKDSDNEDPYEKDSDANLINIPKLYRDAIDLYEKCIYFSTDYVELSEQYFLLSKENQELRNKLKKSETYRKKLKNKLDLFNKKRMISDEDILKIKNLRKQGLSYREIEKNTGWSKYTIGKVLNNKY